MKYLKRPVSGYMGYDFHMGGEGKILTNPLYPLNTWKNEEKTLDLVLVEAIIPCQLLDRDCSSL